MRGIDVSRWNKGIDWAKVKASGIEFAIIKAGGSDAGFYKDPYFERNYAGATQNGIHVGAYYFVGPKCKTYADGKADAERFINLLKGKKFDMPVYNDFEGPDASNKAGNTQAVIGFNETMEKAGYFCGLYASDIAGFRERLNKEELRRFAWWVARYGSKPVYATPYGMWQYSSTGRVNGINGNVDMDECYVDYPSAIINGGFNGYPKKTEPVYYTVKEGDTLESIAKDNGVTVGDILKLNNLVVAGQKLRLK